MENFIKDPIKIAERLEFYLTDKFGSLQEAAKQLDISYRFHDNL